MMDDEGRNRALISHYSNTDSRKKDEEMEDSTADLKDSAPIDAPDPPAETVATDEPPVVVSGGRRRGRRKVMKKKTIKDEEGYLVTKEEPAWESFSEDEPVSQKERTSAFSSTANSKKSSGKPGQGNIMSFFGKK